MAQKSSRIFIWQYKRGNGELLSLNVRNVQDIPLASGEGFIGSTGPRLRERLTLKVDFVEI